MKIDQKVKIWQEKSIITEEIAKKISEFENDINNNSKFLILSIPIASVFIISGFYFIAYNVSLSSGSILIVSSILTAICVLILKYSKKIKNNIFFELNLLIYTLLLAGNISLLKNLFNLNMEFFELIPIWILFSIPAVIYSKIYIIAFFHQLIIFFYVYWELKIIITEKIFRHDILYFDDLKKFSFIFFIVATIIYAIIMIIANKRKMYKLKNVSILMLLISILGFIYFIDMSLYIGFNMKFGHNMDYITSALLLIFFFIFSYKYNFIKLSNVAFLIFNLLSFIHIIDIVKSYALKGLLFLLLGLLIFCLQYYFKKNKNLSGST